MAKLMDRLGYDTLLDGRAPFPARRLRVHPQRADDGAAPRACDQAASRSAAASTSRRCGTRCGWPRISPSPTSSPAGASSSASGRGYHTREVETFGSPLIDQDANRELFEEQVDIIFKAFNNESFSHKGKHYTLPPRGALSRLHARRS